MTTRHGGGSGGKADDQEEILERRLRPVRRDREKHMEVSYSGLSASCVKTPLNILKRLSCCSIKEDIGNINPSGQVKPLNTAVTIKDVSIRIT